MRYAYLAGTKQSTAIIHIIQKTYGGTLYSVLESKDAYLQSDILIMVMPSGSAVRLLAPLVESHYMEPVVLVIDPDGKYVIPLLPGHFGNGNEYAGMIASLVGAQPIMTTMSDMGQVLSFEDIAQRNHLQILNRTALKQITSLLAQGAEVEFHTDHEIVWDLQTSDKNNLRILHYDPEDEKQILRGYQMCAKDEIPVIFLTSRKLPEKGDPSYCPQILCLQPKDLYIGIDSRSRVNTEYTYEAFLEVLERQNLPLSAIAALATTEIKAIEPAIVDLSARTNISLLICASDEIKKVSPMFRHASFQTKETLASSVSAPCAYLASERGKMLLVKASFPGGVTFSVARSGSPIYI